MDRFIEFQNMIAMEGFFSQFKKKSALEVKKFVTPTYNSITSFCDAPINETTADGRRKSGIIGNITIEVNLENIDEPMASSDRSLLIKAFNNIRKVQSALKSKQFLENEEYDDDIPDDVSRTDFNICGMNMTKWAKTDFEFILWCNFPKTNDACYFSNVIDGRGNYTGDLSPTFG